jgi:23S rRNA pseudouridine2457 synthase
LVNTGNITTLAFRYLLFNKPFNVLSQFTAGVKAAGSTAGRTTLADYIPIRDVYPAGRLDADSEGLLLLTSDGEFQHRIADPRYGHARTYWAQVEGLITGEALKTLKTGVVIQGYRTKPAKARAIEEPDLPPRIPPIRVRKSIPTCWLELTLTEGRNRQVRHMTAAVDLPTLRLVRAAVGALTLDGLAPGDWRDLARSEVEAFLSGSLRRRPVR